MAQMEFFKDLPKAIGRQRAVDALMRGYQSGTLKFETHEGIKTPLLSETS